MTYNLEKQIECINNIDKHEKPIMLIKAMESMLSIDDVVERVFQKCKNVTLEKELKDLKLEIIDEFRMSRNFKYFEKEFNKYCGFYDDETISLDILFEYLTQNKDIEILKSKLIKLTIFLN